MSTRTSLIILALVALPGIALARPAAEPKASPAPAAVPARADAPSPPKDVASPAPDKASLDRSAIFQILCGGATLQDVGVQAHLWRVAGSLAERSWTPPRVTVRVVVDASGR